MTILLNLIIPKQQHAQYKQLFLRVKCLQQNPRRGTIVDEIAGLRKLVVSFGKYGFIIHYVILEDDIVILRIYHGRENRSR